MNKKISAVVAILISAGILATASFAWFTSQDDRVNHFETKQLSDGDVSLVEIFTPPEDWKPGQEVVKNINVVNTSSSNALVRISFEEILKKLSSGGVATTSSTADVSATHSEWIPVHMNAAAYDTWTQLTNDDIENQIPAGLIVKRVEAADPASGKKVYSYVAYYDLGSGDYQKVTADFTPAGEKIEISNVLYYFFDGKTTSTADWAGENVKVTSTTVNHPANGTFDFANKTCTLATDSKVLLNFDALSQSMAEDSWYYNEEDGYFYYIGKLAPGEMSSRLLESVTLAGSAGNDYMLMELDLVVLLEGIQNTSAAITSADGGWGLTNTALINALSAYCN